ncbi:Got1/Sft2-like family-domain-containing protein [Tribonema minus]|uniref:Vesicle transport protein n=1 Tax=Tribonema minus TaxID=303371 RepID=A0A835Z2J1_9STRA|nr:Got1/Sft2-like family-domain-containing protein [Tribonema minus]
MPDLASVSSFIEDRRASASGAYESVRVSTRRLLGQEEAPLKTRAEELEEYVCSFCPSLTYKQRLIGFGVCLTLGFILTFGALFRIVRLVAGNPLPFVINYSIGNVISICASFFLNGPWAQIKKMFEPTRVVATGVYITTLGLTFAVALAPRMPLRAPLLVTLVVLQFMSFIWYALSYIPFAREWAAGACRSGRCCGGDSV